MSVAKRMFDLRADALEEIECWLVLLSGNVAHVNVVEPTRRRDLSKPGHHVILDPPTQCPATQQKCVYVNGIWLG